MFYDRFVAMKYYNGLLPRTVMFYFPFLLFLKTFFDYLSNGRNYAISAETGCTFHNQTQKSSFSFQVPQSSDASKSR